MNNDTVNHPSHYQGLYGVEAIEVMRNFIPKYEDAFVGSMIKDVLKYVLRAPAKGNQLEDLKKARKYLDFAISELEIRNENQQEIEA